jgi:RNA polymerase sigma factor (sigma-70 family)
MRERIKKLLLQRSQGDLEAVEEALSETWLATLKSYRTFKHKSTYFTWVCKIALNKLSDYYRRQIRHKSRIIVPGIEVFNQIVDPKISIEEKLVLDELRQKVNFCLDKLPTEYKKLLKQKYYQGLKFLTRSQEGKLYRAKKLFAKIYAQN